MKLQNIRATRRLLGSSTAALIFVLSAGPSGASAAIIGSGAPQAIIGSGSPQAIIGSGAPQAIIGSGSPQAIIGSGAPQAIIGSGAPQAIIGSGAPQAIIGSGSPQAIIGSGAPQAIIGSGSPQAIIGSGAPQAIIGSGAPQAIIGSGAPQAIIGSGAPQAIIGSGSPQAIIGSGAPQAIIGSGSPFELAIVGAVDEISSEIFSVLHQSVVTTDATRFYTAGPRTVKAGTLVAIFGMPADDGNVYATDIVLLRGRAVEGSTPTFVSGYVTESSTNSGSFAIGGLTVQPASAGTSPDVWSVEKGRFVSVEGVIIDGRLYASSIEVE